MNEARFLFFPARAKAWVLVAGSILGAAPLAHLPATCAEPAPFAHTSHSAEAQRAAEAFFSGRVFGSSDEPVAGAQIHVVRFSREAPDAGPIRAITNAEGRFEFHAPDMTYLAVDGLPARRKAIVFAAAEGYAPDWVTTPGQDLSSTRFRDDPLKGVELNLRLAAQGAPIRGRLLDPEGQPLADAQIQLTRLMIPRWRDLDRHLKTEEMNALAYPDYEEALPWPHLLPQVSSETRSDGDGRFTLAGLGRDRLALLRITAPSIVDTDLMVMTRNGLAVGTKLDSNGNPTATIHGAQFTLHLEPGLTVKGLVIDAETREAIPGMWVGLRDSPVSGLISGSYPRVTDARGRFTITGLNPQLPEWREAFRRIAAVSPPGLFYQTAAGIADGESDVVIECRRGIPFRLTLFDEDRRPVEAEVKYGTIYPNRKATMPSIGSHWPISRAARRADGTYEGFVLPGPGAVLVKTGEPSEHRPAFVDPKSFFAPGRSVWSAQEQISAYGTHDTLAKDTGWVDQHLYSAIVLVNPELDSGPLELTATVFPDRPRKVSLVDQEGRPVAGAKVVGVRFNPWGPVPTLRTASFPLTGLHPDRAQRMTFLKEDQQLIGDLVARGDGESPYTVRMQPWATVTGRIVDEQGQPVSKNDKVKLSLGQISLIPNTAPEAGAHAKIIIQENGRFTIDQLVPGLRYRVQIYRGRSRYAGTALNDLVFRPGEKRDLGEVRMQPAVAGNLNEGERESVVSDSTDYAAFSCVLF